MKRRNREINVFSMSALDLFASAMGAFILIAVVALPYYLNTSRVRESDKPFVAITMHWMEPLVDIDLYITTPNGRVFNYAQTSYPGSKAKFIRDTIKGPGVELWQSPELIKGKYKIEYVFYAQHGGASKVKVKGDIFTNKGAFEFPDVVLSSSELRKRVHIATLNVDSGLNATLETAR